MYFLGTSALCSQEVYLFSARNSWVLLYSSLLGSGLLALWCSSVASMPSPSSSVGRSIVWHIHPILLKASRLSARVWYPEPTLLRCDSAGQHSLSDVSFWHSTHCSQSVRHGRYIPDEPGCWGSIKRVAIVSQSKDIAIRRDHHRDMKAELAELWYAQCLSSIRSYVCSKTDLSDMISMTRKKNVNSVPVRPPYVIVFKSMWCLCMTCQ